MLPPITTKLSTSDLLGLQACQLAKREDNSAEIYDNVVKAHFASIAHFEKQLKTTIHNYNFQTGNLGLVLNKALMPESNTKCKPRYFGPMLIIRCTARGSYCLAEIDSTVSKLKFVGFCLVPYLARTKKNLLITKFIDQKGLVELEDNN